MSRNVSFEDPLLNPSTLSISVAPASQPQKEPEHTQARPSLQVDDGPIPFQTTSSDTSSIFSPPPPFPAAQAKAVDFTVQEGAHEKAEPGAAKTHPGFVDPLTAALQSQGEHDHSRTPQGAGSGPGSGPGPGVGAGVGATENRRLSARIASPNINTANSTMPSEFPTHLASPPLPQRPSATFSPAHPPLITTGIHVPSSLDSSTSFDGGATNRTLESTDIGPPPQVPSAGLSGSKIPDSTGMVNHDLKSPVQEGSGRQYFHGTSLHSAQSSMSGTPGSPLQIRPVDQERESFFGIRSPVFAVPQHTIRQEGLPMLNALSMFHDITMSDPMNDLMVRQIPANQRVLRDWNALTEAERRQAPRAEILRELTVNNSWRAMARYTRAQILAALPDQILDLINLWYARLLALVKLGQYEMAQAELEQLGDLRGPQYRYESYPLDTFANSEFSKEPRKGCMVPFELFVLKARLQSYLGDTYEAIDQFYDLIIHCKKFEAICRVSGDSIGEQQWKDITGQLHLMVLNYLVELNDYSAATKYGRELARKYPWDINLHSGLGRLYLQLGDLTRAEEVFKSVDDLVKGHHTSEIEQIHFKLQLTMNRALLAVTQGQWLVAKSAFEEVLAQEPENLSATNNLAVCELYAGQLNEAIPRLERLMFAYPTSAGTSESLVFNMATLYELRTEGSLQRKQQMMVEVSKSAGDQFNVSMFKI